MMRKVWVGFLVFASFMLVGCKIEVKAEGPGLHERQDVHDDHRQLRIERATGLIEIYSGNPQVYLVLDWTTRSRKSFAVVNADELDLRKLEGKVVQVEGEFSRTSAFSGTVKILRVLSQRGR